MSNEVSLQEYAEEFLALTISAIKVRQTLHPSEIQLTKHPSFEKLVRLIDMTKKDNYNLIREAINFPESRMPLIEATKAADIGLVKFLVYHGASPFAETSLTHENAFFNAATVDRPPASRSIIEFFISQGVNRENIDEALAAAEHKLPKNHPNTLTLKLFIELQQYIYNNLVDNNHHGLDDNIIVIRQHTSHSLKDKELDLYIASIISASFSHKAEHEKYKKLSPLNAALQLQNHGMAEALIRNGANILYQDEVFSTPIKELLKIENKEILSEMLNLAINHHLFREYLTNPVSMQVFEEVRDSVSDNMIKQILDKPYKQNENTNEGTIEYQPHAIAISSNLIGKFFEKMHKKDGE